MVVLIFRKKKKCLKDSNFSHSSCSCFLEKLEKKNYLDVSFLELYQCKGIVMMMSSGLMMHLPMRVICVTMMY